MYKLIAVLALSAAVAAFAIGCGASDDETASAVPLSKPEFIKQAGQICKEVAKENEAALAPLQKKASETTLTNEEGRVNIALEEVVGPAMQSLAQELETLTPPAKDQKAVDQMVQRLTKGGKILEGKGFAGMSDAEFSELQREATTYGLKACVGLIY